MLQMLQMPSLGPRTTQLRMLQFGPPLHVTKAKSRGQKAEPDVAEPGFLPNPTFAMYDAFPHLSLLAFQLEAC
jgi:hypothetical protein